MEKEMLEVFGKKVEHKIKEIDKWRTNNCRAVEEENKEVENLREELQLQRKSFEREKQSFESLLVSSPSHSINSTTSAGSTGKKKLFSFRLGSFKFKTNDSK